MQTRTEEDFLGKVEVPADAYYGSFTARASHVFRLSDTRVSPELTKAIITIKKAAAISNAELGTLDRKIADAIIKAADEALAGKFDREFILDAFQAGAGTPENMNVNEVLANRANELLGGKKGEHKFVHPNNHVNMAQSSNDVIPTAIRIAASLLACGLHDNAISLKKAFDKKSVLYAKLMRTGRTHLQDAVPLSWGQSFYAYGEAIRKDVAFAEHAFSSLLELGIGGTALGTGINTHPKFKEKMRQHLSRLTGLKFTIAKSTVETTQNMNAFLQASSSLRSYAVTLNRIANDFRILASGPKAGIAELVLPEVEPGSSIMPGKVNPSVPEAVNICCGQAIANDSAVMQAAQCGQLELNFMTPLIAHNLLESIQLLSNATHMFDVHCVSGLKVDEKNTTMHLESSFAYATALNPYLGYSAVSRMVSEAHGKGISLKQLITDKGIMGKADLERVISTAVGPSIADEGIKKRVKRPQ